MPWIKGIPRSKETIEKIRLTCLNNPKMRGYKLSIEHRKKISVHAKKRTGAKNPNWKGGKSIFLCKKCGNKVSYHKTICGKCWYISKEKSDSVSGSNNPRWGLFREKSPNWKGGITPINKKIRQSHEYKLWRNSIFERDNYTCQFCKKHGGNIEADHIKPFAYFPEFRFSLDNGRTLCRKCHKTTFAENRKYKTTEAVK